MKGRSRVSSYVVAGLASLVAVSSAFAQSGAAAVDTRTSLFLAGGNTYGYSANGGAGFVPTAITITAGTGRVLTLTATGTSDFCGVGVCGTPNPDGGAGFTSVQGVGRIGGSSAPSFGYLAALFLGPALPTALPSQFVVTDINALAFAPALGQVFFVGNGTTSGAVLQQFLVPDGATRVFFGIADAGGFVGRPEYYDDNVGTYNVNYAINAGSPSVVPEPASVALLGFGLAALGVARRRRVG